jgi:hypothetical protein
MGAIRANDFPRPADGCGQAGGDHASSRTDPDEAERLTGIYRSDDQATDPGARRSPVSRCWLNSYGDRTGAGKSRV